ncbi:oligosaccharide flippase family protein [Pseudomonas sp.]|uniref:oligosaccharide flippase family protein n=1 Tax=Pseudomonas sp. TaxID=306 RepID=UPI00299D7922|nr:oligosaccharide flippase family protein [Pseudomonas sp.]MDX1366004.1 oligosaccharide flippase family protein [Pseudomonas sp.]
MARLLMPEMFGIKVVATTVAVTLGVPSDIGLHQNIIQSQCGDDPTFLNRAWTVQVLRSFVFVALTLLVSGFAWFVPVANQ